MRVTVQIGDRDTAYEAPTDTQIGDRVVVVFGSAYPKVVEGTVASLKSDYDGPCREIVHRCRKGGG